MSAEFDFVAAATSAACRAVPIESSPSPTLRWPRVLQLAEAHKVVPLFLEGAAAVIPPDLRLELRTERRLQAQRALQKTAMLGELSGALAGAGIRCLAVKGPALGLVAYGEPARRTFNDLDLWTARTDLVAACEIVERIGFGVDASRIEAVKRPSRFVQATVNTHRDGVTVEIHGEPFARFVDHSFEFERCWRDRIEVDLAGARVATLGVTDTLHYLCLHGDNHAWERLQWVVDVAMAARACDAAAARSLLDRVDRAGHAPLVRTALRLTTALLDLPVATPFDASVGGRDDRADTLVARVRDAMTHDSAILGAAERFRFHVTSRTGRAKRHYLLWSLATASGGDVETARLPHALSWLYPFLRMPGLLRRHLVGRRRQTGSER